MQKTKKTLPLSKVVWDREYYPRISSDWKTEYRYTEAMKSGAVFPPIVVVPRGSEYVIIDGFNRTRAAKACKAETISAEVWSGLPEKQWLAEAARLNAINGRALSTQDRAMIADRLKSAGYPLAEISKCLSAPVDTIKMWVARVTNVIDKDGKNVVAKSSVKDMVGTTGERAAVSYQSPLANATPKRTLDELLGLLHGGALDLSMPGIRERVVEIHSLIGKLLKDSKAT